MSVGNSRSEFNYPVEDLKRTVILNQLRLDIEKQMVKRSRLDFLQLIEKVGGFHDGLVLLIGALLVPLAANYFHRDFVQDS